MIKKFSQFINEKENLPDVEVNIVGIMPMALQAMKEYFQRYNDALEWEKNASGINPLENPIGYYKYELREPEHNDVRLSVNAKGEMNLEDFQNWAEVNFKEMENRRKNQINK